MPTLQEIIASGDPLLEIPGEAEMVAKIAALPANIKGYGGDWHKVGEYAGVPVEAYHAQFDGREVFGVCFVRGKYDGIQGPDGATAQEAFDNAFATLADTIKKGLSKPALDTTPKQTYRGPSM